MSSPKYEQLSLDPDNLEEEVSAHPAQPRASWSDVCLQKALLSLGLIFLYFSLSIGLTFFQRWLLKDFHYPLTVVMYHLLIKWILSILIRTILWMITGKRQLQLSLGMCFQSVAPTGVASGIDVGFSNWGLELVTISLYTMTKSTTIIFILGFAILLGLEKKSWSLMAIVFSISSGLMMFTYKATQFNLLGFNFLLVASLASGLRWTFAQLLMQKTTLGLNNPIDMVYHVQPWMFFSLLPFTVIFEGSECFEYLQSIPKEQLVPTLLKVSIGATIAFAMEISEFLVITYTSSLTLSIAGIFKEMCILVLAVEVTGDEISFVNAIGLLLCLVGITGHIVHKMLTLRETLASAGSDEFIANPRQGNGTEEPLLDESATLQADTDESDQDSNVVLFQVIKRRDAR